jgi:hypothetical protein
MRFPVEIAEGSAVDGSFTGEFCGCNTIKRGVYTMCVVVLSKSIQLLRKILGIPEKRLVKVLSTNGSDQPFDEGVQLIIMSCCFVSKLSATMIFAPPCPRSLAIVVSKWARSISRPFMAEQGREASHLRQVCPSCRFQVKITDSPYTPKVSVNWVLIMVTYMILYVSYDRG